MQKYIRDKNKSMVRSSNDAQSLIEWRRWNKSISLHDIPKYQDKIFTLRRIEKFADVKRNTYFDIATIFFYASICEESI